MTIIKLLWTRKEYRTAIVHYITRGPNNTPDVYSAVAGMIARRLHMSDAEILIGAYSALPYSVYSGPEQHRRATNRSADVVNMLPKGMRVGRYMDFGCADGEVARAVASAVGAGETYGVDIAGTAAVGIKYIRSVDSAEGTFDLITALVSLHHVMAGASTAIASIAAKLSAGGVLVIREHDNPATAEGQYTRAYIQLIHMCAAAARYRPAGEIKVPAIEWHSAAEWCHMIESFGLRRIGMRRILGRQRIFYAAFRKIFLHESGGQRGAESPLIRPISPAASSA